MNSVTSACFVTKQHQKIDSIEKFIHWTPSIHKLLTNLPKAEDNHTPEQMLDVIARNLFNSEFGFWILQKDFEAVGFVAVFIARDVYGSIFGEVWIVSVLPGAKLKQFLYGVIQPWFQSHKVKFVGALDGVKSPAKDRWLKQYGMKPECVVYKKELSYGR